MIEITAQIRCLHAFDTPSYRLFVDGDLITERTWIWNHETTMIEEIIFVNIEPGKHQIKVANVNSLQGSRFKVGTVCVNGKPVHVVNGVFEYQQ